MIDPTIEPLKTLRSATAHPALARDGRKPHINSLIRWIQHGARAAGGRRVRLESFRTPAGLCTTDAAIERFLAALNAHGGDARPHVTTVTRQRSVETAERELAAAGIG